MVRRYRRLRVVGRKWSRECTAYQRSIQDTAGTTAIPLVQPATIGGKRKVGNFQINIYSNAMCLWALVYVPNGTNPSALTLGSAVAYYEPSNHLISQGIVAEVRSASYYVRMTRNLNEGDNIYLLLRPANATQTYGSIAYSICYN